MLALRVSLGVVAVAELLGQVFGQIADAPAGVLRSGEHALGVELGPEPGHMRRVVVRADGVQGVVPVGQQLPRVGVEVAAGGLVPYRQVVALEKDLAGGGPPDLVVGGGEDLPQLGAGDGAAHRDVHVRGQPFLRFDGGEVLHVVAQDAAQVLDEPVEQRGEVQRVPRGALVVVAVRIGRGAVLADFAVGRAGEGEEHRRAEGLAVRGGVGLAHGVRADLPAGQVGGVLAAPGRSLAARPGGAGVGVAAQPGTPDFPVKAAPQAPLARRQRRAQPWGGTPGARRATPGQACRSDGALGEQAGDARVVFLAAR